jgi:hypothetical protein
MGLFDFRKRDEEVQNSFHRIQDTLHKFNQWIQYLSRKDQHQDFKLYELEQELRRQGVSKDKIRAIVQAKYQYHYLVERVKEIDQVKHENDLMKAKVQELEKFKDEYLKLLQKLNEIDVLKQYYSIMFSKVKDIEEKIEKRQQVVVQQKPTLKERIIRKFTQNSKEHTKNFILNLIRKYEEINALQLREIVVEEQGICSKSSFYRALEELEKTDHISVERIGKEKRYRAVHVVH